MAVLTQRTLNDGLITGMWNYCMQAWARTGRVWLGSLLSALGDIDPQRLWGALQGSSMFRRRRTPPLRDIKRQRYGNSRFILTTKANTCFKHYTKWRAPWCEFWYSHKTHGLHYLTFQLGAELGPSFWRQPRTKSISEWGEEKMLGPRKMKVREMEKTTK
jgi:hypothetical protein